MLPAESVGSGASRQRQGELTRGDHGETPSFQSYKTWFTQRNHCVKVRNRTGLFTPDCGLQNRVEHSTVNRAQP